ncbi:DUF421 domain-containing protein [Alkalicella caledoniensis]|uniref:DUF421 domain-containing protein n=1 Tax=Alkalicella caledoniensis TaxID=2731377 RepID=A0A7G9WA05_ALKCA|nr:DUF421 domain-containing protein [Alkalicella caledoniensis]QNO15517.1 DUF421 domain-containing protein [Alkalicella caledoniensis]
MFDSVFLKIFVELTAGFVGLIISVQIIGKRLVSQITPFDFISAIVLGELVGNAIYDPTTEFYHVLFAISVWTALIYFIEKVTQKFYQSRRIIEGHPTLIVNKGIIDFQALSKEGLDFSEFLSMLREKDVLSLKHVEYAILETSGNVTVIKKAKYNQPTLDDLNIETSNPSLNLPVILDGDIVNNNLGILGYDEGWLKQKLKQAKVTNIKDVLYAEYNDDEGLFVQRRQAN